MCSSHLVATSTHSPAPYDLELFLHSMLPRESSAPPAPSARTIPFIRLPTCHAHMSTYRRPTYSSSAAVGGIYRSSRWGRFEGPAHGSRPEEARRRPRPVRALGESGWTGRLIPLTPPAVACSPSVALRVRRSSRRTSPLNYSRERSRCPGFLMRTPVRAATSTQLPVTSARKTSPQGGYL